MGFYKLFMDENGRYIRGNERFNILCAENFVSAPDYELVVAKHTEYELPIDGWHYFESEAAALQFWGLMEAIGQEEEVTE